MKNNKIELTSTKKTIIIVLSIFVFVYITLSLIFMNRFCFGSKINGIDVSFKTINESKEKILKHASSYCLEIEGRNGSKGKILGKELGLTYGKDDEIKKFKDKQNPFNWIHYIFTKNQLETDKLLTFNEKLLKEKLNAKDFFTNINIIEPKNVSLEYSDKGYKIIPEVNGNQVNKDLLYQNVKTSILSQQNVLNLDKANCYEKPKYTSKSKETDEAQKLLNKYTASKITYDFANNKETLDGSTTNKWLYTDGNMKVAFNMEKVKDYISSLASKYNTLGKSRNFVTSTSKTVRVDGGDYGWAIDQSKEVENLIENIKSGQNVEKEPIYSQKALSHDANDIGNTYVEINLTKQHMWFYKNSSLVVDGDVVTGNVSRNFATPAGTYSLVYTEKDATLKGEGYSIKVDFWMPFNGNIGLHNAPWRSEFGKNIYLDNGSHGCINLSFDVAKTLFDNIEPQTPVVCYTE